MIPGGLYAKLNDCTATLREPTRPKRLQCPGPGVLLERFHPLRRTSGIKVSFCPLSKDFRGSCDRRRSALSEARPRNSSDNAAYRHLCRASGLRNCLACFLVPVILGGHTLEAVVLVAGGEFGQEVPDLPSHRFKVRHAALHLHFEPLQILLDRVVR